MTNDSKSRGTGAVAATSELIAKQAVRKIKVEYEVLEHVMNPYEAAQPDAPVLHENQFTHGVEPEPKAPSNLFRTVGGERGDLDKGFANSDLVVEREFTSEPVHQGYIEPLACIASTSEDGAIELWTSIAGQVAGLGFKRFILFNSHGGNSDLMRVAARELRVQHEALTIAASCWFCLPHQNRCDERRHVSRG